MAKKILIVDDAAFMRMTIRNIVTQQGYEVVGEAENGEDAIAKYKKLKPDLVTMDIIMLGMDGLEAIKRILKFDPKANIIMVSAMGQQALMVEAIQLGAKGFIIKPFSNDAVIDEIKRILKNGK